MTTHLNPTACHYRSSKISGLRRQRGVCNYQHRFAESPAQDHYADTQEVTDINRQIISGSEMTRDSAGMQPSHIMNTTLITLAALLLGCATQRMEIHEDAGRKSVGASDMASADPQLDHVFAWIPRDRARTASVAAALVHIELGRAKDEVGRKLCGGDWLINGASVYSIGPYPSTAPAMLGGYPAWYYHVSHEPGLVGCPAMPTEKLYRELGTKLPQWITVKAASPQASEKPETAIATTMQAH